jgi:2-amino-4-hydroxy-6-hydroxymethyldihydropteridine diphosphokinase
MIKGIYLLLGSNLGDRRRKLSDALVLINELAGEIVKYSGIYETQAWGKTSQPAFLNQVVEVTSHLSPSQLLTTLQLIEDKLGRVRREKWGARVIDIDILYYSNLIVQEEGLSIPHPEIAVRRFTLVPLVEIAEDFVNPVLMKSNSNMLLECKDNLVVSPLKSHILDIK